MPTRSHSLAIVAPHTRARASRGWQDVTACTPRCDEPVGNLRADAFHSIQATDIAHCDEHVIQQLTDYPRAPATQSVQRHDAIRVLQRRRVIVSPMHCVPLTRHQAVHPGHTVRGPVRCRCQAANDPGCSLRTTPGLRHQGQQHLRWVSDGRGRGNSFKRFNSEFTGIGLTTPLAQCHVHAPHGGWRTSADGATHGLWQSPHRPPYPGVAVPA